MVIIDSVAAMEEKTQRLRTERNQVGFVPTMGALHEGHLSLIRRARADNHAVVASIFVNPIQFGPREDFSAYPRDLARDADLCRRESVDVLFTPRAQEMYPPSFATTVRVRNLTEHLCGLSRPGHFDGVATVVAKLLSIVRPHHAYFGLKDYQQYRVVERMAADLNLPVMIHGLPIVREADGLAMSSRNAHLSVEERASALSIFRGLTAAVKSFAAGERRAQPLIAVARRPMEEAPGARIDYLDLVDPLTLETLERVGPAGGLMAAAVFVGKTRLIDNVLIGGPK